MFDAFLRLTRQRRDGPTYTFGQVDGFSQRTAYSAILEAQKYPMAVIRNANYFEAREAKEAKQHACSIREILARILPQKAAAQQPIWRAPLAELEEVDPCVDQ